MPAKVCTNLFIAIFTVVIMAENCHKISAIQHEIEWNITTDFYAWSRSKTFYVGDSILFRYNQGLHSVVEVNGEDEFAECDTKNAVRSWKAGKDIIEISREGAFYFICGMPGYCYEGMKIKVVGVPQPPRSVPSTQTCLTTSWIRFSIWLSCFLSIA